MNHSARFKPASLDRDSKIGVVLGAAVVGAYLLFYVFGAIGLESIDALAEPAYPETILLLLPGFLAGVGAFFVHHRRDVVRERNEWKRAVRLFAIVSLVATLGVYAVAVAIVVLDSWAAAVTLVPISTILYLSYLAVLVLLAGVLGVATGISGLVGYYAAGGIASVLGRAAE